MNKTELVSAMAERLGASKKHSEEALTVALDLITEALAEGEEGAEAECAEASGSLRKVFSTTLQEERKKAAAQTRARRKAIFFRNSTSANQ